MGTAGRSKLQFMVLLDPSEASRIDALRIVMGTPRAEIIRRIVRGTSLKELESAHAERLARLLKVSAKANVALDVLVFAVSFKHKVIPLLEELESMDRVELRSIIGEAAVTSTNDPEEASLRREELFRSPADVA